MLSLWRSASRPRDIIARFPLHHLPKFSAADARFQHLSLNPVPEMGKKKNKAKQLALNATQAQNQPQPLSNPPQPCPNGTASSAVTPTTGTSIAAQPKKRRRMTKAEKRQRRLELGIGKEAEAMRREVEDLKRDVESHRASDLNCQPPASATAFFSTAPSSQDTNQSQQSQRKARKSSFVGNALLNVLEEVQGNEFSLPEHVMPMSARNGLAMDGSNDKPTSERDVSRTDEAQQRGQDASMDAYNFAPQTMPHPASTFPQSTPGAPYGYNMANAMWDWNNAYGANLGEGQQPAQTYGYQYQAPTSQSQVPVPMAAVWGQPPALPPGFPQLPVPMDQVAYLNPAWHIQGQLGPGGIAPWISPHQRRAMSVPSCQNWTSLANNVREPTQYRGYATDSQTPPWRINADPKGQSVAARSISPRKSQQAERPNKPGPPRPNPSPQYLAQSQRGSYRLTVPQHLLIVIDLNGTLLFRPKARQSSNFIQRPFTRPFISYLFANHTVMVWSSARPENVNRMCNGLFSPAERKQLKAEWARDMLGLSAKHYNEKVQVFKELSKVWEAADAQQWHPQHIHGERFDQRNTLLIDDSVEKAASEPYNLVEVDDFEAKEDQMSRDVLREVAGYLEDAKLQSDVSAWCCAGNRFAYGKGWDREWQEDAEAPSNPPDQVSSGNLGDGLVPASPQDTSQLGQQTGGRVTRSQKKRLVQEENASTPISSGQQGGVLLPAPPNEGGDGQAPGVKLSRGARRNLRKRQEAENATQP
ncbi:NLI interacting factor-like phosphatase-domain-containing protein [Phyllosticta capitalensis]